ncbi:MAG: hypothetical protein R3D68_09555 [Hyphomicrobiaceae bacterium]
MSRNTALATFAVAAAVSALSTAAFAQQATTTRVETRPFYGATVTLEAGVRVFRPLPPHSKVVINPGGRTPLSLSFEENRTISHNYEYGSGREARDSGDRDSDNGVSFASSDHNPAVPGVTPPPRGYGYPKPHKGSGNKHNGGGHAKH